MKKIIVSTVLCFQIMISFSQNGYFNPSFQLGENFQQLSNNYNVDSVGKWHNDALDYFLQKSVERNLCSDDPNFLTQYNEIFSEFFATKGITMTGGVTALDENFIAYADGSSICSGTDMSPAATAILCELSETHESYVNEAISLDDFMAVCVSLRLQANNLVSENEKYIVGATVSVANSSTQYWAVKLNAFMNHFKVNCNPTATNNFQNRNPYIYKSEEHTNAVWSGNLDVLSKDPQDEATDNMSKFEDVVGHNGKNYQFNSHSTFPVKIPWGGVVYADLVGAYSGAKIGFVAAGGPAGAVACGLMGAAAYSGLRLLCYGIFNS